MRLEDYVRQARGQKLKLRYQNAHDGMLRLEFKALGHPPHVVYLKGDKLVTLEKLRKQARKARPQKAASKQQIEAGVKAAIS